MKNKSVVNKSNKNQLEEQKMSFLFARKKGEYFYILSDTKINCSEIKENIQRRIGKDKEILLENYGIIKNVIINKNLCIGCAGVIEYFNELLEYVEKKSIKDIEQIKEKALEIHRKYKQKTDFIILYVNNSERNLFVIKDNRIEETDSCWIGIQKCFNLFQTIRHDEDFIKGNYDMEFSKDFNEMCNDKKSFEKVLKSNISPDDVGKYYIDCTYTEEGFHYMERSGFYVPSEQTLQPNESINFYDTIENGGCSYISYCENNNYSIYYEQIKTKITFEPYLMEQGYNYLRFPKEILVI